MIAGLPLRSPHIKAKRTAALVALFALLPALAGFTGVQRFMSPGKSWIVEANVRDPGGLGAPQTVVMFYSSHQKVGTFEDNILIVDGAHIITPKWEEKHLIINCPQCDIENAMLAVTEKEGYTITYVTNGAEPTPSPKPAP